MPPRKVSKPRRSHFNRATVGAGTGLGKSILIYDKGLGLYVPHPSEGGHSDFPATMPWERELIDFMQDLEKGQRAISYEDLLSGKGLERIYRFLRRKGSLPESCFTRQIDATEEKAPLISQYVDQDESCKEAFRLFLEPYAKCARNFAMDTLALGGSTWRAASWQKTSPTTRRRSFANIPRRMTAIETSSRRSPFG